MISNWATYYNAYRLAAVSCPAVAGPLSVVRSQSAVGSGQRATHNSQFTIHYSEFLLTQPLSFQQYSRFPRVTTFVFCNIPALGGGAQGRSFVFNNIPASFVHFLKLLISSCPIGGDMLS